MAARQSILIVEDDIDLRRMFRIALALAGYDIEEAADGITALHLIDQRRPTAIVLDLGLPKVSGYVVLEELVAQGHARDIPVIIVTALSEVEPPAGAKCLLRKPVTPEELVDTVRECILAVTAASAQSSDSAHAKGSAIVGIALLTCLSLGNPVLADAAPSAVSGQFTQDCQTSNPRLERLASAIQQGDVDYVRAALDAGLDVNETWRDVPAQICRSLLLRSVWYGRDDILNLLLNRGTDPRTVPGDALGIPVRSGRLDMVRTLLDRGLKLPNKFEIVLDAIESRNMAMFDLVASSGVTIDATTVPSWALTDALTAHLVPKYFRPNDRLPNVGNGPCTVQELFGLLGPNPDGCEGTPGPLWLHFVVAGNIRMLELMIKNGADLSLSSTVWDYSTMRPFNAMDVAVRRKDRPMVDFLRRAGAPAGIWGKQPRRRQPSVDFERH